MNNSKEFFQEVIDLGFYNHFSRKSNISSLEFKMTHLFNGIDFKNKEVLDIGGGNGIYSFYAAYRGAKNVICIEPVTEGSNSNMEKEFYQIKNRLQYNNVVFKKDTIQDFNISDSFDIILSKNSINHFDESNCARLLFDNNAIQSYTEIFRKIYNLMNLGGKFIITDCSRNNFWNKINLKNPVAKSIDWNIHQAPETWAKIGHKVGFHTEKLLWNSLPQLGMIGKLLTGNRLIAYFLTSHFTLVLKKAQ